MLNAFVRQALKRFVPYALRVARLRRKAENVLFDWRTPLAKGFRGEDWSELVARVRNDPHAPRVLMATTVGGHLPSIQFDAMIAAALTLRGVRVAFLICDEALPACMADQHDWYPNRQVFLNARPKRPVCDTCYPVGNAYLAPLGLEMLRLSDLVSPAERKEAYAAANDVGLSDAGAWRYRDMNVGEHGLAGALRFHARASLEGIPLADRVLRAYLRAGAVAAVAAENIAGDFDYDVLVAHHGIYIPQGIWISAARNAGKRVVAWNPGYRRNSFILSEGDTYHKTMISENLGLWSDTALDAAQQTAIRDYLSRRRVGSGDWISFGSGRDGRFADYLEELGLDRTQPTIGLLTSVAWDAQLHYESNAFEDQFAWIDATIRHFTAHREMNLIIRVHPAERTGFIPTQQPVASYIAEKFGALQKNIAVVGPESPLNTYALADGCDTVLIFSTKTGIELSAVGTPVVVAGEAWIRGKGFSIDADNPAEYDAILRRLPLGKRLTPAEQQAAERYAYHFFFRRMIELPGFVPRKGWPPYRAEIAALSEIAPGTDANLDEVCREIVSGGAFLSARVRPL